MTIKVYVNKSEFDIKSKIEKIYKDNDYLINILLSYIILLLTPFVIKEIFF